MRFIVQVAFEFYQNYSIFEIWGVFLNLSLRGINRNLRNCAELSPWAALISSQQTLPGVLKLRKIRNNHILQKINVRKYIDNQFYDWFGNVTLLMSKNISFQFLKFCAKCVFLRIFVFTLATSNCASLTEYDVV